MSEPNAAGQVIYTPPAGGLTADSFVITADDGAAGAAPVSISLAIKAPPPPGPPPPQLLAGVKPNLAASVAKLKKRPAAAVRKAGGAKLSFRFLKPGTVAVGRTAEGKPNTNLTARLTFTDAAALARSTATKSFKLRRR